MEFTPSDSGSARYPVVYRAMHERYRFVENIRAELDAPGEWYHDRKAGLILFFPPAAVIRPGEKHLAVRAAGVTTCRA